MLKTLRNKLFKSPWDNDDNQGNNIFNFYKKDHKNYFANFNFLGNGQNKNIIFLLIGVIVFIWLASGIYKVDEGEEAVILRFGKFVRINKPGLNYHLPEPIETFIKEKVDKSRRIEIGYRSVGTRSYGFGQGRPADNDNGYRYVPEESIMLTGDENIVDLNCDIMWRISNLTDYAFNIANPEDSVKSAAESAIREVIGKTPITNVLSSQKQEIAEKIQELTQKNLNLYVSGVFIENVQLLKAEPPSAVIAAYRDVQTSRADKERLINEALAYKNGLIPGKRGEAEKIIQEAEGYRQEAISIAKGDAERFNFIYREYSQQKGIMRDRLYYEAIEEILKGSKKILVGKGQVLPHLPLKTFESE